MLRSISSPSPLLRPLFLCAIGTVGFVLFATAARAQEVPKPSTPLVVDDNSEATVLMKSVLNQGWESDPVLDVKVSFKVKRLPFPQFLDQLQQKTKVKLGLQIDSSLNKKSLTAVGSDMPLSEVLSSLCRLYGMKWTKGPEDNYVGSELMLNDLERELLKFGNADSWRSHEDSMSGDKRQDLAAALISHGNIELLKSKGGQPLAELPPELQEKVKEEIGKSAAIRLVGQYSKANIAGFQGSKISVAQSTAKVSISSKQNGKVLPVDTRLSFDVNLLSSKGTILSGLSSFKSDGVR